MRETIETMQNAISTLIECVGALAENHPDPEVKLTIATKLAAFAWSEGDFSANETDPV